MTLQITWSEVCSTAMSIKDDLLEFTVEEQELVSNTVFTLEKESPKIESIDVTEYTDSIEFDIEVIDTFDTIDAPSLFAALFIDDVDTGFVEPLVAGNNFGITFNGLLSGKKYEIRIMTDYDLNDGTGTFADVELFTKSINTLTKSDPITDNFNVFSTEDEISFDVEIIDTDGVIVSIPVARLYVAGVYAGNPAIQGS